MKRKIVYLVVALAVFLLAGAEICLAQADLTTVERITVKVDRSDEAITIIQDYSKKKQWYYVPNRPRLVEQSVRGKTMPVFNLVRYQFRDGQTFDEGGIMQFAINFALPGSAIEKIKSHIAGKMTTAEKPVTAKDINVVSLPINNAWFYLYSPGGEKMMTSDTPTEGMAPTFASQNIPFSLSLTKEGGAVFKTIVEDTLGGIPVIVVMEYTGLTPPAGFKCTVDWTTTYKRVLHDAKMGAALSGVPYVTPGISGGYSNLRARLENDGCIKLEVIEGSGFNLEDADRYLQPILTIMAREMFEDPSAPSSIPAPVVKKKNPLLDVVKALQPSAQNAVAGSPAAASGGAGLPSVSINLSYTMRDEKLVRTGKQVYEMNVRRAMSQTTGNYVGLNEPASEMYGKVLSIPDALLRDYFIFLTDVDAMTIVDLPPRDAKRRLARELVTMYHSEEEAKAAEEEFDRIHIRHERPTDVAQVSLDRSTLKEGGVVWVIDLLQASGLVESRAHAKRLIEQGGVTINDERVMSPDTDIPFDPPMLLQVGKRSFVELV